MESRRSGGDEALEVFRGIGDLLSPEVAAFLEQCAILLPDDSRQRLRRVMQAAGKSPDAVLRAIDLVRAEWEGLRAEDQIRIAVVGPARAGKSGLVELLGEGASKSLEDIFAIYDLQGLEEYLGYGRSEAVYQEIAGHDLILLILDGSSGFTEDTVRMASRFGSLGPPVLLVLNKIELVERPRKLIAEAKARFGFPVVTTSLRFPETVTRLLRAIVTRCPSALHALSRHLPEFRRSICRGIISEAAFGGGLLSVLPMPVPAFVPIAAVQVAMVLKLARAHGFEISSGRVREVLPVLAAGFLVRQSVRRLKDRFPSQAGVISLAASGASTYLMGLAAEQYFERLRGLLEAE